jgi:hypothetical protein
MQFDPIFKGMITMQRDYSEAQKQLFALIEKCS